jgi:hypothetical protein
MQLKGQINGNQKTKPENGTDEGGFTYSDSAFEAAPAIKFEGDITSNCLGN